MQTQNHLENGLEKLRHNVEVAKQFIEEYQKELSLETTSENRKQELMYLMASSKSSIESTEAFIGGAEFAKRCLNVE